MRLYLIFYVIMVSGDIMNKSDKWKEIKNRILSILPKKDENEKIKTAPFDSSVLEDKIKHDEFEDRVIIPRDRIIKDEEDDFFFVDDLDLDDDDSWPEDEDDLDEDVLDARKRKRIIIVCFGLIVFLTYLGGFLYFSTNFYPNTTVNKLAMGFVRKDDLKKEYQTRREGNTLHLIGRGKTEKIAYKDIDYTTSLNSTKTLQGIPWAWPVSMFLSHKYEVDETRRYNDKKLATQVSMLDMVQGEGIVPPSPPRMVYKEGDGYVFVQAVEGNLIDQKKLCKALGKALEKNESSVILNDVGAYVPADRSQEAVLQKKVLELNKLLDVDITWGDGDETKVFRKNDLIDLYKEQEDGSYVVNPEKIHAVVANFAAKRDTVGATRTLVPTGYDELITIEGGIYGFKVDQKASAKVLSDALANKKSAQVEPVYSQRAAQLGDDDVGKSYLEVDLERQHVWLYKDGAMVLDSPIVSGDIYEGHGTPTGTGMIWSKEKDRQLKGETWNSHVDYWMPFNYSNCGFHDASWRDSFGGEIYKGNGSHGCINLPPDIAGEFYEQVPLNLPVYVY